MWGISQVYTNTPVNTNRKLITAKDFVYNFPLFHLNCAGDVLF